MLGQMEEEVQHDVDALIAEFRQKLASLSQQLDKGDPQQELLERVSTVAYQISPLQLVNMMKEIDECGTLVTIPKEVIVNEAGQQAPPAEQPAPPEQQAPPAEQPAPPAEQQVAAENAAQPDQEDNAQEMGNPAGDDSVAPPQPFKVDLDLTDESDTDTDPNLEDDEYVWTAYLLE